jgi:hypothetical protein
MIAFINLEYFNNDLITQIFSIGWFNLAQLN